MSRSASTSHRPIQSVPAGSPAPAAPASGRRIAPRHRALRALAACLVAAALLAGSSCAAFAEDRYQARETTAFNVEVQVGVDNTYEFTETVDTVFNTPGHGIYRYVPEYYNGVKEKVDGGWCSGYPAELYEENNNYVLQIGDADRYLYDEQTFEYGYRITMLDDRDETSDLLYLNVFPTNWETSVDYVHVAIDLPKSIEGRAMRVYSGALGSTNEVPASGADGISWAYNEKEKRISINGIDVDRSTGITVMVDLPEGYWEGQANTDWALFACLLGLLAMGGVFFLLWWFFGRMGKPVETVEFYPPEGMTPAEAGYIADGSLDKKDMVSMFMYFADKGYLTITPEGKKDFLLTKRKDPDPSEQNFVHLLFSGIFPYRETGVRLSDLGDTFAENYQSAKAALDDATAPIPATSGPVRLLLKVLLFAGCWGLASLSDAYVTSGASGTGLAAGSSLLIPILALLLCRSVRKRRIHEGILGKLPFLIILAALDLLLVIEASSCVGVNFGGGAKGLLMGVFFGAAMLFCQYVTIFFYKVRKEITELLGRLLGLRRFIQTAEAERIDLLVEENPNYFYDVLPYAYVMGVTDKWAKRFENVNVEPPEWYRGACDMHSFNTIYFASSMGHFSSVANTAPTFTIPDTSGDSGFFGGGSSGGFFGGGGGGGFSGGGFSGGGGGGGGGGFW